MNRENYDQKVISTFEIIACFIIDTYYNDLFLKARDKVRDGRYASLTDAYKANVVSYMQGVKDKNWCSQVIRSLHGYYQRCTSYSAIIFSDFENKILSQFIPAEYFRDFTERDKDANLYVIITRTVQEFSELVLEPRSLGAIIDDHKNERNIIVLQDSLVNMLKTQREEYYLQFAKKINQRSAKVSEDIVRKLETELAQAIRQKCTSEQEKTKAAGIIGQLVQKIADMEKQIADVRADLELEKRTSAVLRAELAVAKTPAPVAVKTERTSVAQKPEPADEDDEDDYEKQRAERAKMLAERRQKKAVTIVEPPPVADLPDSSLLSEIDDPGFG